MIAKQPAREEPYGWVIVAVVTMCMTLGFGAGATVSVLMKPFEEEFGWSRADISMAYTMHTIGAAIGGLFWGGLSDRIGARKIAFIGAVAMSAGLMALKWQSASVDALCDLLSDRRDRICLSVRAADCADGLVVQRAQGTGDRHYHRRRRHRPGDRAVR